MSGWFVEGAPQLAPTRDPGRAARRLRELSAAAGPSAAGGRVAELLDEHGADLADRTTAPGHLTGSALVVDASRTRVLLMLHAKLGRWLQPGGHADGDHELAGVALREAREETGIDGLAVYVPALEADVHTVDHGDALGAHLHLDVRFLVAAPPGAVAHGNHESTALRWVTLGELRSLADEEGLVRLAEAGLSVALTAPPPPGGWIS